MRGTFGSPPPLGLTVAAALLVGVSLVQLLPALPPLWLSAAVLVGAAGLFSIRHLRLPAALLFGIAWACLVGQWVMQSRWDASLAGKNIRLEGRVLGLPQWDRDSVRFDFRVESAAVPALIGKRLRLGWYQRPGKVDPGSRWHLVVRLKRVHGVLNPGGYDFEKSALLQRLVATGYVRDPALARQLAPGQGMDGWRDRLSQEIGKVLPNGRARFVQALAVGDTRALTDNDWEILRATGLTHQIAISGFHVGLVAGFGALGVLLCYRLLPNLGRGLPRPQAAAIGALLCASAYTALAGFALPTVRTWLMIAAVLTAKLLRRAQSGAEAFALALIVMVLLDPLAVLAPGFWLSFIGVAWLLWCLPHQRNAGVVGPFLQAQGVALVGLLPLTVWFFGQTSLPGPFTNLLGVPLISLAIVPLALFGLLAYPVSTVLAAFFWRISAAVMNGLWDILEWLAHSPAAMVWLPEPSLFVLMLALCGAFWLLLPRAVPGKGLALLLFLPLLWPDTGRPEPGSARIAVLDVGQGLSVLVRTHDHALLFDAGPASARGLDFGEAAVVPALRALGVHRLDRLIISHGDNDHAGGVAAVRRAYPQAIVQAPPGWASANMQSCLGGKSWQWDGVRFRILHPPPLFPYLRNDSSCVLRIDIGGRAVLLPGDIGRHVETRLVRENAAALRADLLIVSHHGSSTSSSPAFIAAVRPRIAVVTTGAENRFRLPRAEIVARYRRAGSRVLNTAGTGALDFVLNENELTLRESRRQRRARYWHDTSAFGSGYAMANP